MNYKEAAELFNYTEAGIYSLCDRNGIDIDNIDLEEIKKYVRTQLSEIPEDMIKYSDWINQQNIPHVSAMRFLAQINYSNIYYKHCRLIDKNLKYESIPGSSKYYRTLNKKKIKKILSNSDSIPIKVRETIRSFIDSNNRIEKNEVQKTTMFIAKKLLENTTNKDVVTLAGPNIKHVLDLYKDYETIYSFERDNYIFQNQEDQLKNMKLNNNVTIFNTNIFDVDISTISKSIGIIDLDLMCTPSDENKKSIIQFLKTSRENTVLILNLNCRGYDSNTMIKSLHEIADDSGMSKENRYILQYKKMYVLTTIKKEKNYGEACCNIESWR